MSKPINEILEIIKNEAKNNNFKILTDLITGTKQKVEFECENNHTFQSSYNVFSRNKHGLHCTDCKETSRKTSFYEKIKNIAEERNAVLVSKEYVNDTTKLSFKCNEGHDFSMDFKKIREGSWCQNCCSDTLKTENKVKMFLEVYFQQEFKKERFDWNINKDRNQLLTPEEIALSKPKKFKKSPLELDLYNDNLKIAFEYDGDFHYKLDNRKRVEQRISSLSNIIRNDIAKTENCQERGITLYKMPVIKYNTTKDFNKFKDIFIEFCSSKGLDIKYTETQIEYMKQKFDHIKSADNHIANLKVFQEKSKRQEAYISEEAKSILGNVFSNIENQTAVKNSSNNKTNRKELTLAR